MAIYLLIAGSYTPLCLLVLRGRLGLTLLGVEWALAAIGIGVALLWRGAPVWVRLVLYLGMGWLVVLAFGSVLHALPAPAIPWMIAGGLSYSIGAVVFATNKPHLWPGRFSAHDLWHVFVLSGSACHFFLLLRYVALPMAMG
jgi:hemolysin III